MKVILHYTIPFNVWDTYEKYARRFATTFKNFPPGHDCKLFVSYSGGLPIDEVVKWFYGIKTEWKPYYGDGCQIGAEQDHLIEAGLDHLFVGLTSHAYFHRSNWLKRMVEAFEENGRGIYSVAGSMEIRPHLRTSAYWMEATDYPSETTVKSREDCSEWETGENSVTSQIIANGLPAFQVTWDDVVPLNECRIPQGIYRRGEQNAMLVWDRHTDVYRDADAETKRKLEILAGDSA